MLRPIALSLLAIAASAAELLNVSYDVSRELYKDLNAAWGATATGAPVAVKQSHGGSSKQARAIADGLEADVVTFNQALDIDHLAGKGLLPADWRSQLPHGAAPSWSTMLILVRAGNPKGIKDWGDLAKPGVEVIIPNPKTAGNGRYSWLAAWAWARRQRGGDAGALAFLSDLLAHAPVLPTGGRDATNAFVQRGQGDALLTFEGEIARIREEFASEKLEVVVPSLSIRADNPVAVVETVAAKKGTLEAARAYLAWHYGPEAQAIFAKHHLRPAAGAVGKDFAAIATIVTVEEEFGGWAKVSKDHFADGGFFDQAQKRK